MLSYFKCTSRMKEKMKGRWQIAQEEEPTPIHTTVSTCNRSKRIAVCDRRRADREGGSKQKQPVTTGYVDKLKTLQKGSASGVVRV